MLLALHGTLLSISVLTAKTTVCHKSDLKCDFKKINQNLGLHAVHVVHKSNFSRWDQGSRCMLPIGTEKTSQGEDKGEWF